MLPSVGASAPAGAATELGPSAVADEDSRHSLPQIVSLPISKVAPLAPCLADRSHEAEAGGKKLDNDTHDGAFNEESTFDNFLSEEDSFDEEPVRLTINGLGGTLCEIDAWRTWCIADVKSAVEEDASVPRLCQRLLHDGIELRDIDTLGLLPRTPTASLILVRRPEEQVRWLQQVEADWSALIGLRGGPWEDKEVVSAAVRQCGWALKYACDELRSDVEIVRTAVEQNGLALRLASDELRADRNLALTAVAESGRALAFVAEELRNDRAFILDAVGVNGRSLEHAPSEFKADREVVLKAVSQCGCALASASAQLRRDVEVVLAAVAQDGAAINFAAGGLRVDPDVRAQAAPRQDRRRFSKRSVSGIAFTPTASPSASPSEASDLPPPLNLDAEDRGRTYMFGAGSSDGNLGMKRILGESSSQLCELANLGLPVVPGFCFTAGSANATGAKSSDETHGSKGLGSGDADMKGELKQAVAKVEEMTGQRFADANGSAPLLLSVRSDSTLTVNGKTVELNAANIGLNDTVVEAWASRDNSRLAWDSYRRLITTFSQSVKQLDMEPFERATADIQAGLDAKCQLGRQHDVCDLPVHSLQDLVAKYKSLYMEQTGEPFPQDPDLQLMQAVQAATRRPASTGAKAAVVQAMVFGNYDDKSLVGTSWVSGEESEDDLSGEWMANAQNEDLMRSRTFKRGHRKSRELTVVGSRAMANDHGMPEQDREVECPSLQEEMPGAFASILQCVNTMQLHVDSLQGIDFTIQAGKLWITRARVAGRPESRNVASHAEDMNVRTELLSHLEHDSSSETKPPVDAGSVWEQPFDCFSDVRQNAGEATISDSSAGFIFVAPPAAAPFSRLALYGHRFAAARPSLPEAALPAAEVTFVEQPPAVAKEEAGSRSFPRPFLPLWQTALAGALAAAGSRAATLAVERVEAHAAARAAATAAPGLGFGVGLRACLAAAPRGAFCTSWYVNLQAAAAPKEGDLDGVSVLPRLFCAAFAASAAGIAVHPLERLATAATRGGGLPALTLAASGPRGLLCGGLFRGLGTALAASVPLTAVEMCAIDVFKVAGVGAGFNVSPGLLLASGTAAGVVSAALRVGATGAPSMVKVAQQARLSLAAPAPAMAGLMAGVPSGALMVSGNTTSATTALNVFKGAATAVAPTLRGVPAVAVNSLVRVGLVTQFINLSGSSS